MLSESVWERRDDFSTTRCILSMSYGGRFLIELMIAVAMITMLVCR